MWILLFLMAFGKVSVNRPGTGSFSTRQKRDTKARQVSRTSPAASPLVRPGKRAAALNSLFDEDDKAMYKLVERISKAEMRVSINALFFQMYKLPPRDQWSGPDGVCTKIVTNLCCSAKTMLKVITWMDAYDLNVDVRDYGSGGHNKKINLGTVSKYKKKLEKLFKEKHGSKNGPKGGNSVWADYDCDNPYQERYGDDWHQHLPKTFKWHGVRYYNIK